MSKWKIDTDHATAQFKVKHLGISWVPGHIYGITGEVEFDEANPEASKFSAEIDTTTLTTGMAMRDGHLKSADFFDVENYPKMRFVSKAVKQAGENKFEVVGDLTIKNITKEVKVEAEFLGESQKPTEQGMLTVGSFAVNGVIDRRDYEMIWNIDLPGGKLMVGNEAYITIDLELIKV